MKTVMASVAALAMVATAGAAQAATFTYDLSSTFDNGDRIIASGTFEADDAGKGDGTWTITGADGSITSDPGGTFERSYTVISAPARLWGSQQTFTLGQGGLTSADFALRTTSDFVVVTGQGNATNGYKAFLTESGGAMTLSIKPATAAVPEPATWALMLGGFGAAGVALRRRRRSADRFAIV